jgi:dipeptidyl aminopeptidase/acylaminoacyl peptidase
MPRSIRIRRVVSFAAAALVSTAATHTLAAQAAATHFPTNEDLRHTRTLGDPRLSPDGQSVLFSVTEPTVDSAARHLWIGNVQGGTARQLTAGPGRGESQGEWSPDGKTVYFTAKRGEHTQLFRLPMGGGEAIPYVVKLVPPVDAAAVPDAVDGSPADTMPVEADVSSFAIAPDGRTAAILVRDPETPGEKKQTRDKADAHPVDQELHGTRVYLLDLQSSALTPVAVLPDVREAEWSHRSDRLAVVTSPMNNEEDLAPGNALWIVDVATPAAPRKLAKVPPTVGDVAWSRGDARIFFTAQAAADAPPGYGDLMALTLADGAITNLSRDFRGTIAGTPIAASDDAVLVPAESGTQVGYVRFDTGHPGATPVALGHGVVGLLATNDKRTGWVYTQTASDEPTALYFAKTLDASSGTKLDAPLTAGKDWRAVKASVVRWKSDGRTIEGLLYLPPASTSAKVPLVLFVHGGPSGVWTERYSPFVQYLVGHGWAVLMPNPRGSTGYGTAFAAANKNDLGGGDYRDVMAGVDFAIANYPIDATKLAFYGYSYGGEMAGFVEGKTDRFKAIVSGAPVIDQFSEYGTEGNSYYDRWYFGRPWEHVADAWRQSPLAGVGHAKTPFMLLQGEDDTTDPLGQSQEMYRALRQMGVPVQLITYPRENHGPLSGGISGSPSREPWHGFDARQRIVRFFESAFTK